MVDAEETLSPTNVRVAIIEARKHEGSSLAQIGAKNKFPTFVEMSDFVRHRTRPQCPAPAP